MRTAFTIALEHYRWARRDGQSHREILVSVGAIANPHASTAQVLCALQRAWMGLRA